MRKLFIPVLAAASLAGVSAPAAAAEVTFAISYADLDLSNPADVAVMKDRIDAAVARACGRASIASLYGSQAVMDCKADGKTKALELLDARRALAVAATQAERS